MHIGFKAFGVHQSWLLKLQLGHSSDDPPISSAMPKLIVEIDFEITYRLSFTLWPSEMQLIVEFDFEIIYMSSFTLWPKRIRHESATWWLHRWDARKSTSWKLTNISFLFQHCQYTSGLWVYHTRPQEISIYSHFDHNLPPPSLMWPRVNIV